MESSVRIPPLINVQLSLLLTFFPANLTDSTKTVFSPRFNPQGTKLVFFECVPCGPHHSCAALKMVSMCLSVAGERARGTCVVDMYVY